MRFKNSLSFAAALLFSFTVSAERAQPRFNQDFNRGEYFPRIDSSYELNGFESPTLFDAETIANQLLIKLTGSKNYFFTQTKENEGSVGCCGFMSPSWTVGNRIDNNKLYLEYVSASESFTFTPLVFFPTRWSQETKKLVREHIFFLNEPKIPEGQNSPYKKDGEVDFIAYLLDVSAVGLAPQDPSPGKVAQPKWSPVLNPGTGEHCAINLEDKSKALFRWLQTDNNQAVVLYIPYDQDYALPYFYTNCTRKEWNDITCEDSLTILEIVKSYLPTPELKWKISFKNADGSITPVSDSTYTCTSF